MSGSNTVLLSADMGADTEQHATPATKVRTHAGETARRKRTRSNLHEGVGPGATWRCRLEILESLVQILLRTVEEDVQGTMIALDEQEGVVDGRDGGGDVLGHVRWPSHCRAYMPQVKQTQVKRR
jgi:hypothetical protein